MGYLVVNTAIEDIVVGKFWGDDGMIRIKIELDERENVKSLLVVVGEDIDKGNVRGRFDGAWKRCSYVVEKMR